MKIILLSLDNEVGKARRNKINYDYDLIYGVSNTNDLPEEYKNRIHIPYNSIDKNKIMKQRGCCMYGHLNILNKIVNENLHNVIICEDDAILKDNVNLNDLKKLDSNEAILLNSKLHHPTNYKYDKDFNDKNILFENGLNDIDFSKFRWSCSACIYYPTPKSAQIIIDFINNNNRLTHFDLLLSKNKVIKKLILH